MRKMCQLKQFVTWDRSFCHIDRRTFFADVVKARFEDFERADVVEASYQNFERNRPFQLVHFVFPFQTT